MLCILTREQLKSESKVIKASAGGAIKTDKNGMDLSRLLHQCDVALSWIIPLRDGRQKSHTICTITHYINILVKSTQAVIQPDTLQSCTVTYHCDIVNTCERACKQNLLIQICSVKSVRWCCCIWCRRSWFSFVQFETWLAILQCVIVMPEYLRL